MAPRHLLDDVAWVFALEKLAHRQPELFVGFRE